MKRLDLLKEFYQNLDQKTRLYWGIGIACLLLFVILFSSINERIASLEKRRKAKEADLIEMMSLKQRLLTARMSSMRLAGRMTSLAPDDSPAKVIEEIGITGKSSRVSPLKGEERAGFMEETAEVKLEGLSANDAVNLLFRLEKGSRPVIIKKANFKTRFDDPSRMDVTLVIALLKPVAQGQR